VNVFDVHRSIIDQYTKYVQSFLSISDERVRRFIEEQILRDGMLWPDALVQLNPAYERAETVQEMVQQRRLNATCGDVFRTGDGVSFRLYRHQREGTYALRQRADYDASRVSQDQSARALRRTRMLVEAVQHGESGIV